MLKFITNLIKDFIPKNDASLASHYIKNIPKSTQIFAKKVKYKDY